MNGNHRDLSQNPCHMCMPMGGIMAFKGIEGAMTLLHGSQGCSTYMRRHIAEHFNEPVDVASSSLNEKGTVYGGQAHLKQGIANVRKVYAPKLVGIMTTCLAETIGEDVPRIIEEYKLESGVTDCKFVGISTPGYGGTHSDGYWAAVRGILQELSGPAAGHQGVNVIVPCGTSPADLREIKRWFELMEVPLTLLPDISETLDRPYGEDYQKIAPGGTTLSSIRCMSGARGTIEFSGCMSEEKSPGVWLQERYGVSCRQLALPIGLANTDLFFETVSRMTGKTVPDKLRRERGLLMDAMIDAHKHSFQVRPVIFGDPETVQSISDFCAENGMLPGVVATAGADAVWRHTILAGLAGCNHEPVILENTDMSVVFEYAAASAVNLAVGPSTGKMMEEKLNIPLVRVGFPIQDRLGGQRVFSIGYGGTVHLLDRITNTWLERMHHRYRRELYEKYYCKNDEGGDRHDIASN